MKPHAVFALAAFMETRRLQRSLRTPEDVAGHRERRLRAFFRHVPRAPFYAGMKPRRLGDLPIVDKTQVNARFEAFNIAGVTADEAWAAIAEGRRVRGLIAGCSTGTSGNRGLFLASERERFVWLGVMLAKALPDVLSRRHRVALVLPAASELYEAAPDSGRLSLRFFDLRAGLAAWREVLDAYAPDVIVAPPKILRALAESPGSLAPAQVFSGAEVLDPLDRAVIETAFGVTVREIYQATEGLFGVACERGVLHLCEDTVAFEWEPVAGSRLVQPLVTDFTRRTQVMARYRMNDLLDLAEEPCACGSPLQGVRAIHGRQDDIFDLGALVTPDVLRNAVVDADRRIADFRILQTGPGEVVLELDASLAEAAPRVAEALSEAIARAGARATVQARLTDGFQLPTERKLRRVERLWRP